MKSLSLKYISKLEGIAIKDATAYFRHNQVFEYVDMHNWPKQPVWEDSCVEFFCKLPEHDHYYYFEFNCIGTCLATRHKGRELDIQSLPEQKMKSIKRYASLGNEPFNEKTGHFEWELTVEIPFDLIEIQPGNLPATLRANFYKCGDGTSVPHYLSWNQIVTGTPDFHCPEFFRELFL